MILLDTHALVWVQAAHRRAKPLLRWAGHLFVSPASLFELCALAESGRVEIAPLSEFLNDARWMIDDPPSLPWFQAAFDLSWTRDPFDRLIAAHSLYRGFRLATADERLLEHLGPQHTLEL